MPNLIEFEWERPAEGYEIVWPKPSAGATTLVTEANLGPKLKPKSGRTIRCRPLDEHPALFKKFAELDKSPEATLEYANQYGLINDVEGWACELWYEYIEGMRAGIAMWERDSKRSLVQAWNNSDIGRTNIKLVYRGKEDVPGLAMVPASLLSAMYLQLAQAITRNNALQRCLWCGTWFLFGAGTGRRRSAHYCSDHCRKVAHRDRKEGSK